MTTLLAPRTKTPQRVTLPGSRDDRLFFAQVREDAQVELTALTPRRTDRVVVVSSGGCTALSFLAAGAAEVHAVDVNRAQNHLVELKLAAVTRLPRDQTIGFLGGTPMSNARRTALYVALRDSLGHDARAYWNARTGSVCRGVIDAGVSERFIGAVCWMIRHVVHSPRLVDRMLACASLDQQRALFDREWNTRAWRALFTVMLNRWTMSRAYDPRFFAHVGRTNFAEHFRRLADHALTEVPIADNYFLHKIFAGRYPVERPNGVPAYLMESTYDGLADGRDRLRLVDGSITDHLRTLEESSVDVFALSNVCEWLDESQAAAMFHEVERTAAPGARVVFRNFVGWSELPADCRRLTIVPSIGEDLIRSDRSGVQSRVVVCRVESSS